MHQGNGLQGLNNGFAEHLPVLASELVDLLDPQPEDTIIDCTFGAGGHARAVADALGKDALFIGIDRDPVARQYFEAFERFQPCRCRFMQGNFSDALADLTENDFEADLIYMDLGVSSMQLDRPERGFSYSYGAPLDMRMDPGTNTTAENLVNELPYRDLVDIFRSYGEERYARQIAKRICYDREKQPFENTLQLVDAIKMAIPTPARFGAGHPARRVFQALRIAVNNELDSLERGLANAFELLAPGGRLAVISFHSLEDRITKQFFASRLGKCTCPPDLPQCVCGSRAELRLITRRPVSPTEEEISVNPRSQSAKLRVVEKL